MTIDGASGILFNVTGGPDLSLFEVNQAAAIIRETAHPDANMIFGAVIDETMGDELRITVIATGFERGLTRRQVLQQQYARPATPAAPPPPARPSNLSESTGLFCSDAASTRPRTSTAEVFTYKPGDPGISTPALIRRPPTPFPCLYSVGDPLTHRHIPSALPPFSIREGGHFFESAESTLFVDN